ncbi:hypothetical protein B0D71_29175 [Pseudomonas laurylsulfativorans]|uniref:Uncharacterized protein n=1 Tax=Pseudomonas laurylsulfativorans TaxID=1943631 RepID=A0A2S3VFR8_9PSED|nr:hypothetical protein B0D71_29175 [Pseudomonas laurylsulfativorans]
MGCAAAPKKFGANADFVSATHSSGSKLPRHRYPSPALFFSAYGVGAVVGAGSFVTRSKPQKPAVLPKDALSRYR